MNPKTVLFALGLSLMLAQQTLHAQQSDADIKHLAELRTKADAGDAKAQYALALYYNTGHGATEDVAEAAKWFRKAAEQNLAEAQFSLAQLYANGDGVSKDDTEAVKWYRKAAEQNLAAAQYCLGMDYIEGRGVANDANEGVKWMTLAAAQGWKMATDYMAEIESSGTEIENKGTEKLLAEGKRRANDWLEQRKSERAIPPLY